MNADPPETQRQYITYGIRDPRSGLFVYVGQTGRYEKRQRDHLKRRDARPRIKTENIKTWMFDALSAGVIPQFILLETAKTEADSLLSETNWVKKLAAEGHPLLNRWKIHRALVKAAQSETTQPVANPGLRGSSRHGWNRVLRSTRRASPPAFG
jgi:hypothetical protein